MKKDSSLKNDAMMLFSAKIISLAEQGDYRSADVAKASNACLTALKETKDKIAVCNALKNIIEQYPELSSVGSKFISILSDRIDENSILKYKQILAKADGK